jgi:EAL domain-containing protein (putative c-di-GMP-specific phosphodiesterase class I)
MAARKPNHPLQRYEKRAGVRLCYLQSATPRPGTRSDIAMDTAKVERQDKIKPFEAMMHARLRERADMEKALREAIANDHIKPFYQPIVDLKNGNVNGFEALARWEITPGQFVPPSIFIEVAEQSDLIVHLTRHLLQVACRDAEKWPRNTILSFNISPTQLQDALLGVRILNTLTETGLPPERFEVEITETALVRDLETAERVLNDLHAARVRISLDDFGTGYSSLSQLSRFTFDKIKIDRSFISELGDVRKQEKIVRAIIGLGKGLNILTTAEGIETPEQLSRLVRMGCNLGQGYLFGKAMPAGNISAFLDRMPVGEINFPEADVTLAKTG